MPTAIYSKYPIALDCFILLSMRIYAHRTDTLVLFAERTNFSQTSLSLRISVTGSDVTLFLVLWICLCLFRQWQVIKYRSRA